MAQQVNLHIELENGKQLTHYRHLHIQQSLFVHQTFDLVVPFEALEDSGEVFFHKAHEDLCGKGITFSFSHIESDEAYNFSFKGIVSEVTLQYATDLSHFFHIKGYAPTCLLDGNPQRRTFLEMSLADIFSGILGDYPGNILENTVMAKFSGNMDYMVQYDESDFTFLNRLAAEYGEWFFYDGKELYLGLPFGGGETDFYVNGLQTFEVSVSLQPQRFQFSQYDYIKDEEYRSKSDNADVKGLTQLGDFAMEESENLFFQAANFMANKSVPDGKSLDDLAKIAKGVHAGSLFTCRGSGENPELILGKVIHVKKKSLSENGSTHELGKYRLIEISHSVDANGNYQNFFRAVPDELEHPPVNPYIKIPTGLPELAKVIDNDDPEALGRVKVKFFWISDKNESDWIRVVTPYTGDGKGMLWTPEIDSQVLIGYEDRSVLFPVVLGNMVYKKDGFSYSFDKNKIKSISTAAGNKIILNDESGNETITISNSNNKDTAIILSFNGDGSIEMKTNGPVKLTAKKEISVTADGDISLSSKQNITISAGKEVSIEAKAGLKAKGMKTELASDSTMDIKANAVVQIKGATIQLN